MADHIVSLDDIACHNTEVAGGKGASLGRMRAAGLPVPPGFVVTADALNDSLTKGGVAQEVMDLITGLEDGTDVAAIASRIQAVVRSAPPWEDLAGEIVEAYEGLGDHASVAVRSSACAEDSESASFAGQQESFLNISGSNQVLENVVECWASYFSERALFYRQKKASLADMGMAVVVQQQIASDKSGVMFTNDPIRRRSDQMVIEAIFGLGEAVVSGLVTPDNYVVRKSGALRRVRIGRQDRMVIRDDEGGTVTLALDEAKATSQVLDEDEIARLVAIGLDLEERFGTPQDIEWALEGDELYVLQSRPITA